MLILCSLLITHSNNMLVLYWCMAIMAMNVLNSVAVVPNFGLFFSGKPVSPCTIVCLLFYLCIMHLYIYIYIYSNIHEWRLIHIQTTIIYFVCLKSQLHKKFFKGSTQSIGVRKIAENIRQSIIQKSLYLHTCIYVHIYSCQLVSCTIYKFSTLLLNASEVGF